MKLSEQLAVIAPTARIRIIKGKPGNREPQYDPKNRIVFCGYLGSMEHIKDEQRRFVFRDPVVNHFAVRQEVRHREYKQRGLLPPYEPELTREYEFKDLTLCLYYDIYVT